MTLAVDTDFCNPDTNYEMCRPVRFPGLFL